MNNVENRIVEMKFDNEQFESAVAKTMDTLDKFKEKLNFEDAGKGMDKLGKASGNYQYTLNDIGQSLDQLNGKFSTMGNIGRRVLENLTDSAYNLVSKGLGGLTSGITSGGLSRAMNLEQAKFQMQGIYKDANKVKEVIYDDILPELQGTPYSLDQAAVVIGQLGASGIQSAKQIRQATRAIAGLAAMSGRGFDEVGRIFSKVAGQGNMMGGELQQLSRYGINAAADISKYFTQVAKGEADASKKVKKHIAEILDAYGDLSEGTIRDAASKRMIYYADMASAMDTLYGEHAKKSTEMYTGALEDLKAALARIGAEPAAVGLEVLKNTFNALVPAVDAVNAVLKPFTNATKGIVETAEGPIFGGQMYGTLAKEVQSLGVSFANLFVEMDENGKITRWTDDSIAELTKTITDADGAVHNIAKWGQDVSAGDAVMNPNMWRTITAATQSFVNILKAVRNVLTPIGQGIAAAFPKLTLNTIAKMAEGVEKFTHNLILSKDSIERLRWITQGIFTPLSLGFRVLVTIIKSLITASSNLYGALKPVFNAGVAFLGSLGRMVSGLGSFAVQIGSATVSFIKFVAGLAMGLAHFLKLHKLLEFTKNGFNRLATALDTIGAKAGNFFREIVPKVRDFGKAIAELLRLKDAAAALKVLFTNIRNSIAMALHLKDIGEGVKQFTDKFKELLEVNDLFTKLVDNFKNFLKWIGDIAPYEEIVEKVSTAFDNLAISVSKFTKKPAGAIKQFFIDRAKDIGNFIKNLDQGGAFIQIAKSIKKFILGSELYAYLDGINKVLLVLIKNLPNVVSKLFGFKTFGDMMASVGKKVKSVTTVFLEFIGILGGIAKAKTQTEIDKLTASLSGLFNNKIVEGAKALGQSLKMKGEGFGSVLAHLGESISKALTNLSPQSIKKFIYSLTLLLLAYKYIGMLRSMKWAVEGFAELLKNTGFLVKSLSSGFGLKNIALALANTIKLTGLAFSLMIFAGAVFILSKMNWQSVLLGSGILLSAMLAYLGILTVLNKMDIKGTGADKVRNLAIAMAAIGGGCLLLVEAIKQISSIWDREHPDVLIASMLSVITLMFAFVGAAVILGKINGANTVALGKASFAIIGIAQGMKMMAEACAAFGNIKTEHFEQGLAAILVIFGSFSLFAASVKVGAKVFSAAAGMMVLAATLLVLQKVLDKFGQMDPKVLTQGGNAVGTILAGLSAFALIAGQAQKSIFGAAVGMIAVASAIAIIVLAMEKIGSLKPDQFAKSIGALVVIFAGFAAIAGFAGGKTGMMAGGAFLMMAAGILALSFALQTLSSINLGQLLVGMGELILMCGAVAVGIVLLKGALETLDLEDAANLALIGAGLFLLASAIGTLASVPIAALAIAIIGLGAALLVVGLAMSVFSAIGPGLLVVAGAFALLGVAALFVGAGLMFLTLALASLIPLILSLSVVDHQALTQGLQVLGTVAKGLSNAFFELAKGILAFGGACLVAGIGLIAIGAGLVLIGIGAGVAALGVALFAGALALLAVTIQKFFGGGLLAVVADGFTSFAEGFKGMFRNFWTGVRDDAAKESQLTGKSITDNLTKGVEGGDDDILESITSGPEDALAKVQELGPDYMTTGTDLNTMLGDGFTSGGSPLSDSLGLDLTEFSKLLDDSELDAYAKANGLSGALGNGYDPSAFMKQLDRTQKDTSGKLSILPGVGQKQGAATGAGLAAGENSKQTDVKRAASSISNAAKPPSQSGTAKNVGIGIGSGLVSGMKSMFDQVKTWAKKLGNAAGSGAKDGAEVNSPSKLTIPVGESIGEGLIVGMERIQNDVVKSGEELGENSAMSVSKAMQSVASLFDADADFAPTITPVVNLENVRQSVSDMNTMLNSSFGLNTPFSGMYNAQMAAASFNNSDTSESVAINKLSKKIEAMTESMNSRSLNVYNTIDGASDPEAFADGLIRSFRLNARTI